MAIETYWGNTVFQYSTALLIFSLAVLVIMVVKHVVALYAVRFAIKSRTLVDDGLLAIIKSINAPFAWFASFMFALQYLQVDAPLRSGINKVFIIWAIIQIIIAIQIFIDYVISERLRSGESEQPGMVPGILSGVIKIGLWLTALLFILSNLGVNITSLVAGLGIGGIAIALAAQNVLGDLFSSLAIFFDKPFVIGDYIVVGANSGTVKKIGIKTTRIKALSGEEISIPNKDIAAARISNYRRMKERRAVIDVAVPYGTSAKILAQIPEILQQSVNGIEHARFSSAFLTKLGDSSIKFQLVFMIDDRDYGLYQTARQRIILNIVDLLEIHKIKHIAPGQTLTI